MKSIAPAVLAAFLLAGCISGQTDWQARIGTYTINQARHELGTPDESATLPDGTVVDKWITRRGHLVEAPEPYFLPAGSYFGSGAPAYTETQVPDSYLQLTFGPDGRLKAWKQFGR